MFPLTELEEADRCRILGLAKMVTLKLGK